MSGISNKASLKVVFDDSYIKHTEATLAKIGAQEIVSILPVLGFNISLPQCAVLTMPPIDGTVLGECLWVRAQRQKPYRQLTVSTDKAYRIMKNNCGSPA